MYGNPPVFHASVPPTNEVNGQLIVRARQGYWALWTPHPDIDTSYSPLARDAIVDALWNNRNDWYPVFDDPCERCGHYIPRCSICLDHARYFIDDDQGPLHTVLCDQCGPALEDEERWEMGLYACCDGCLCDSWK